MTRPTEITTERLLLRPFRLSDVDDVLAYASDPEWAAFYPRPYDRGKAEYTVARAVVDSWDREAEFAVVSDGRVVGLISLTVDLEDQTAELGYDIAREMWGRGIATEAAAAVCDWGFREYKLARVYAMADSRNTRSHRVMQKLGMKYEGTERSSEARRRARGPMRCATACCGTSGAAPADRCPPFPRPPANTIRPIMASPASWPHLDSSCVHSALATSSTCSSTPRTPSGRSILLDSLPQPYTRRDADRFVADRMLAPKTQPSWNIVLDGAGIGGIILSIDSKHETGAIHYALARTHWGQGLMTEAVAAVVDWGFRRRGLSRISSHADLRNRRSWRVMEKLGMTREGVFRSQRKDPRPGHPRVDFVYYALLRDQWKQATDT